MQPGEITPITLDLALNPDEPVGSVQTFDVVQTGSSGLTRRWAAHAIVVMLCAQSALRSSQG
jgi:hypothetical protein